MKQTDAIARENNELPMDSSLNRTARLYTMLLDSIPSSVLLFNPQMQIESANQNFLTKAHLTVPEVIGQQLEKVFPNAIYYHMNLRLRINEVFRSGTPVKGERMLYRAPGLPARTFYYSLIPFRHKDKIENVMLLMEDVTEMIQLGEEVRRTERHLASVIESASDIVLSMDTRGRILTWNTAAVQITRFEENDVRNRTLGDLCQPAMRNEVMKTLAQIPQQKKINPVEFELVGRDGKTKPICWAFSPMRNEHEAVVGLVAVGRDLTERRIFEDQLRQTEKLAALGVMAGGIAHEIRNPLAVISAAAQMLLLTPLTQEQKDCADRMEGNVQRMAIIVESLLRFARPSGKGQMASLDLIDVASEAVGLITNQAKLAKIEIVTQFTPNPVLIQGHASLLQQLFMNLLLNAINAMAGKGGRILLSVTEANNQAIFRITDSGLGIPADHLPKVFDPFFTTMPVGQGTGLGLSISYAIVQQHHGKINIASKEGIGTTVNIEFPMKQPQGDTTS